MLSFNSIKLPFRLIRRFDGPLVHGFPFVEPKRAMSTLTFQRFSCKLVNRLPTKLDLLFTVPEQQLRLFHCCCCLPNRPWMFIIGYFFLSCLIRCMYNRATFILFSSQLSLPSPFPLLRALPSIQRLLQ